MIGNNYSVAELIDLVAAKDTELANIDKLFAEVQSKPFDLTDISNRLSALKRRYQTARVNAEKAIADGRLAFAIPNSMIMADSEYRAVLSALNPRWQEHTWSSGDGSIEDIDDALMHLGATRSGATPIPQPSSGSDFDLNQMHAANTAITMAEGAATGAGRLLGKGVSGLFGSLDMATIAKIGIVAGLGVVFLPKLLAMGPAKILMR